RLVPDRLQLRAAVCDIAVARSQAAPDVAARGRGDAGRRQLRRCVLADRAQLPRQRFRIALDRSVRAGGPRRVVVVRMGRATPLDAADVAIVGRHRQRTGALAWLSRWKSRSATSLMRSTIARS